MTLAYAGSLVARAVRAQAAVPAFNVIALEHAEAIVSGAESAGVDVLLQISENAIRYHGGFVPLVAACQALARSSSVGVGIHLDHIESPALANEAMDVAAELGIGSIMVDASALEYAANVAATSRLVEDAHRVRLWVEAELGEIGGKDGAHAPGVRTDPLEAREFVAATTVDALAVAVGSSHAMTERSASLDLDLIAALAAAVPVPLVLHGSSGVPEDVLESAVRAGIRKVNVGTALNIAWTGALRLALASSPSAVDPRRSFALARADTALAVARLCEVIAAG